MTETAVLVRAEVAAPVAGIPAQADNDAQVKRMWLHRRPDTTRRAYEYEIGRFFAAVRKPIRAITLADMQDYSDSLAHLAPASRNRALAAVRSLLTFAHDLGYTPFNAGRPLKLERLPQRRAERILTQAQVLRMIDRPDGARDRAILHLFYYSGVRVSELAALCWKDARDSTDGRMVLTVVGKGGKTRHVTIQQDVAADLRALRPDGAADSTPLFISRKGGEALTAGQVRRVVKAAAAGAGIEKTVTPHWLRHAHASHALDRGCPVHVLQAQLGHASLGTTTIYAHVNGGESSGQYLAR